MVKACGSGRLRRLEAPSYRPMRVEMRCVASSEPPKVLLQKRDGR